MGHGACRRYLPERRKDEVSLGSYKPSELPDFNILVYNEESYVLYDNDVDEVDFTIHDGDYVVFLSPDGDDSIVVCTSEEYDNLYAGDGENAPTGYTGRRAWADWRYVRLLRLLEA